MKVVTILILVFLKTMTGFSQTILNGKIVCSNKPVCNVLVTNLENGNYDVSNEDGNFEIEYNTLTEIEATFRVLKTDLSLRPVFHKKDENTEAYLFLGLLAYQLVTFIRYQLKMHNILHDWRNIVRIMNTQKLVTSSMKTKAGKLVRIKKSSLPKVKVKEIYDTLNLKYRPFSMKKSVVPET